ncbi:LLM class F420-dependent oxidoreductase [Amycolatopsis sp. H20-H5]|uniref:LLM class F420-dependent oxidoreductase n=1 Tax=Amycolatopsis sp. H20-H5 TaxID=3046309 RepID=UPI002DBA980A|nr:LLM class F420-dependent oxidoreductase [Amycolatopsis sp. H20-H5]MEC3977117.1 LLM class F420-dependent oxidoreductase [Amycolatopsis sp. H20-H5]
MKFGIGTFVTDQGSRPDVLGKALEERGFDSLFVAEHSHIPASRESQHPAGIELPEVYYRTYDPFVALTAAAVVTTKLLLGTGVALLAQRDVIYTAKEVASLDHLSGGRVLFGVGVGWNREEMADHGTDPRTRGKRLDEQLIAIKRIWTEDEATFHGDFVNFDRLKAWPKPVAAPHPPIYVGGNSPAALARLAAHGDVWTPTAEPGVAGFASLMALREEHAPGVPVSMFAVSTKNEELLEAYAAAGVQRCTFHLATRPEAETLGKLDELVKFVERYR